MLRPATCSEVFEDLVAEQDLAAFNQNVGHDVALLLLLLERSKIALASYFARKSSKQIQEVFLKSGRTLFTFND